MSIQKDQLAMEKLYLEEYDDEYSNGLEKIQIIRDPWSKLFKYNIVKQDGSTPMSSGYRREEFDNMFLDILNDLGHYSI